MTNILMVQKVNPVYYLIGENNCDAQEGLAWWVTKTTTTYHSHQKLK